MEVTANDAWNQAINTDRRTRLVEIKESTIDSEDHAVVTLKVDTSTLAPNKAIGRQSANNIERENKTIQSALYKLNPIKVSKIDSLFQIYLERKNIHANTVVTYHHDYTDILYSSTGNNVISKNAFQTAPVITGLDNSIILKGYVDMNFWTNIVFGRNIYVIWFAVELLSIAILCFAVYGKRHGGKTTERNDKKNTEESDNKNEEDNKIVFSYYKKTLSKGDISIPLTPLQARLFYLLATGDNHFRDYDSMLTVLWHDETEDRRKLEQLRRFMMEKLKSIPEIDVKVIRYSGYQIVIKPGFELVLTDNPSTPK
jgi:hypothetical protein